MQQQRAIDIHILRQFMGRFYHIFVESRAIPGTPMSILHCQAFLVDDGKLGLAQREFQIPFPAMNQFWETFDA